MNHRLLREQIYPINHVETEQTVIIGFTGTETYKTEIYDNPTKCSSFIRTSFSVEHNTVQSIYDDLISHLQQLKEDCYCYY